MKNTLKRAFIPLSMLALLAVQGCRQSPQSQSKPATVSNANNSNSSAASQQQTAPETHLKVGDQAPDFTLSDTTGNAVKLSNFRGKKNVTLAFYVLAFTGG